MPGGEMAYKYRTQAHRYGGPAVDTGLTTYAVALTAFELARRRGQPCEMNAYKLIDDNWWACSVLPMRWVPFLAILSQAVLLCD